MLFFTSITNLFLSLYVICGLSDFVDGKLARHLDATSLLGSKLDTVGDILYYIALAKILFVQHQIPIWFYIWIGATVVLFIIAASISKYKFGKFYFIHSFFGKILGVSIFALPFISKMFSVSTGLMVVCSISTIASIETVIIQLTRKEFKY